MNLPSMCAELNTATVWHTNGTFNWFLKCSDSVCSDVELQTESQLLHPAATSRPTGWAAWPEFYRISVMLPEQCWECLQALKLEHNALSEPGKCVPGTRLWRQESTRKPLVKGTIREPRTTTMTKRRLDLTLPKECLQSMTEQKWWTWTTSCRHNLQQAPPDFRKNFLHATGSVGVSAPSEANA